MNPAGGEGENFHSKISIHENTTTHTGTFLQIKKKGVCWRKTASLALALPQCQGIKVSYPVLSHIMATTPRSEWPWPGRGVFGKEQLKVRGHVCEDGRRAAVSYHGGKRNKNYQEIKKPNQKNVLGNRYI